MPSGNALAVDDFLKEALHALVAIAIVASGTYLGMSLYDRKVNSSNGGTK